MKAELSLTPRTIDSRLRGETPESLNDKTNMASQGEMSRHADASKYLWRLSLPPWLSTKALEVYSERLCHGWKWVFRTYNVIPSTSKVVSLTVAGKVEDLQNLFAMKQASPFDRTDRFGYTLLHVCRSPQPRHDDSKMLIRF
jgi:hypothetical protein